MTTIKELEQKYPDFEIKKTGCWRSPYAIIHKPHKMQTACTGIRTLATVEDLIINYYRDYNCRSYWREIGE